MHNYAQAKLESSRESWVRFWHSGLENIISFETSKNQVIFSARVLRNFQYHVPMQFRLSRWRGAKLNQCNSRSVLDWCAVRRIGYTSRCRNVGTGDDQFRSIQALRLALDFSREGVKHPVPCSVHLTMRVAALSKVHALKLRGCFDWSWNAGSFQSLRH